MDDMHRHSRFAHTVGFMVIMCSFRQLCRMFRKNRNASSVSADIADALLLPLLCERGCDTTDDGAA